MADVKLIDHEEALDRMAKRIAVLEAIIESLTAPVSDAEFDDYFRPNYPTRDTATVPDINLLISARRKSLEGK